MKNRKRRKSRKSSLLLIAVAALLVAAVGSTVAYLVTDTKPVVNTFTPATVHTEVTDEVNGNTKSNVQIKNNSNIPVYMRVAVVANWCNADGEVVAPWDDYSGLSIGSNWNRGSDGYYYYNGTVAAGAPVTLFNSYTATGGPEGAHLEMDIISQVIQAEGMGANSALEAFTKAAAGSSNN